MQSNPLIGYHVGSSRANFALPFKTARELKSTICAIFLKGQFAHSSAQFTEKEVTQFKSSRGTMDVYPHACYTMNFMSDEISKQTDALKSLKCEAELCSQLGITCVNIHPGFTSVHDALHYAQLAESIRKCNEVVGNVKIVIENMTGGTKGCSTIEQLKLCNDQCEEAGSLNAGYCLDTCHLFAASYDVRNNLSGIIKLFDINVGINKLCLMHFNGSKTPLGSNVDRHASLFGADDYITGCFCSETDYNNNAKCECGESFLDTMMNELRDIPKIFEPPHETINGKKVPEYDPTLIDRLVSRIR
jgi:apurinic endonuclease APN1